VSSGAGAAGSSSVGAAGSHSHGDDARILSTVPVQVERLKTGHDPWMGAL
jgi:hypothetical protein